MNNIYDLYETRPKPSCTKMALFMIVMVMSVIKGNPESKEEDTIALHSGKIVDISKM